MTTTEGQEALIKVWAQGTTFEYNPENRPKAEFARLAKTKGWAGGDADWLLHWEACFGEIYPYGRHVSETTTMTSVVHIADAASTPNLADHMRRLSLSSNASSFSIISAGSSVRSLQSLDSNGSIAGGVVLSQSPEHTKTEPRKSRIRQRTATAGSSTGSDHTTQDDPNTTNLSSHITEPTPSAQNCSPFWLQFDGFEPAPTATFKDEFARLAKHQGWGANVKRKRQVEALTAEVAFHCGTCLTKLHRWQELCEEMGVEEVPTSITQCKKALQTVSVSLFNFIDHQRNPEVKIVHFKSHSEFCQHIRAGNYFPRQCAKQDGFIKALLKRL